MKSGLLLKVIEFVRGKGLGGETIRYLIVGASTTLLNVIVFELMWGPMCIDVRVSNVTSIVVAIIFAYITNKLIVFRRRSKNITALAIEFCKFIASRLLTMALEVGIFELFHTILEYNARLVKYTAVVIVIIANYVLSKLIVFRNSGRE